MRNNNTYFTQLPPVFAGWKRSDFEAFAPIAWEREQLAKAARRERVATRLTNAEVNRQARKQAHAERVGGGRSKKSR